MEFDHDFLQVQQYLKKVNPELVVILKDNFETDVELLEKLVLQIKIYGSKIIELYQSLDEICPTDRQIDKISIQNKLKPAKQSNFCGLINEIDYNQVWQALAKGFTNDTFKAIELLQQLDYQVQLKEEQKDKFIEFLQISNRCKDQELEKLCQVFPSPYPQTFFSQLAHLTTTLQQYSSMIPMLVSENEQLQVYVEQNKQLSADLVQLELQLQSLQSNQNPFEQTGEIKYLRQQLTNIEKQLHESNNTSEMQQNLSKQEETIRSLKKQLQQIQIDKEDLAFKLNSAREENKSYQIQLTQLQESFEKMQAEYKRALNKKNQQLIDLEDKSNSEITQRTTKQCDLEQLEYKIQQFKQLYEQKVKSVSQQLVMQENENQRLREVVKQSALEVDSLRIQIETVMNSKCDSSPRRRSKSSKKKQQSIEYLQLLKKYQEMVERNEQLSQQLYSQILEGSVLSHSNN